MNTLNRKSWGDLARHRTRTLLAAGTLAIAIASLGFLAVPGLLNAAMNRQVQQGRLNEVAISTRVTGLTPAQLGALGRLPGVAAVSADLSYVHHHDDGRRHPEHRDRRRRPGLRHGQHRPADVRAAARAG